MNDSPRLNTRLPRALWAVLRLLGTRWGLTHDQVVRKLIADAGGLPAQSAQDAPGSTGASQGANTTRDAVAAYLDRNRG